MSIAIELPNPSVAPSESANTRRAEHSLFGAVPERQPNQMPGQMPSQMEDEISQLQAEVNRLFAELARVGLALSQAESLRAEAEANNRAKDEALVMVSHELRTPLNSILGWTLLLRAGKLDAPETARALEAVEHNARLESQLINDLLDFSRVTVGKLRLRLCEMELAPVIRAALEIMRPLADTKAIHLCHRLDTCKITISGDPARLQQVVWNLLSNAIKFTPTGGRVEVQLERTNSHAQLTVNDTGRGIAPDFLSHVFEPYRQADTSLTLPHPGLGLGLTIVQHLVELHGGTVTADSRGEGHGAIFTVKLPLLSHPAHANPGFRAAGL